jgi:hypothetical protein
MDTPTHVFEYVFENPSAKSETENEFRRDPNSNSYTYSASGGAREVSDSGTSSASAGARNVSDSSSGFVCAADGGL